MYACTAVLFVRGRCHDPRMAAQVSFDVTSGVDLQRDLARGQVDDTQSLRGELLIEPIGLWRVRAIQEIDPDTRIGNDHDSPGVCRTQCARSLRSGQERTCASFSRFFRAPVARPSRLAAAMRATRCCAVNGADRVLHPRAERAERDQNSPVPRLDSRPRFGHRRWAPGCRASADRPRARRGGDTSG